MLRVALFFFVAIGATLAEPAPSAKEILENVRLRQGEQQLDLNGQLRQDNVVIPFQLIQGGPLVRYIFTNPDESWQLSLGEKDSRLDELSADGGVKKVAQFDQHVRGTDVTLEDLAMKFLYWPNAEVLGDEKVRTRDCWKLRLRPPSHNSQYSSVNLWVDRNGGALMRMEGYDWEGKLAKRFEVVSAQKIDNRWFLKQMRIETLDPGTDHVHSRTYLEIKK